MDADAEAHVRVGGAYRAGPGELVVGLGGEDDQQPLDTGVARPRDDGLQVGRELLAREMAVAVDHRRGPGPGSRVPGGVVANSAIEPVTNALAPILIVRECRGRRRPGRAAARCRRRGCRPAPCPARPGPSSAAAPGWRR